MSSNVRRVLVVDDNPSIHEDFRKIFQGIAPRNTGLDAATAELFGTQGDQDEVTFELEFASQGHEGLEQVRTALAQRKPFSMAFIDIQMPPGWDGIETMARIWEIAPDLQVVVCTAYSTYSLQDMIKKVGRSDRFVVLKKPFDSIEVLQMANAFTEKWQLLRELNERARKLEESQHRYRFLAEATPGLVWTATPNGNLDYLNQRWCDFTGLTVEESKNWGWQTAIHAEDLPECLKRWTHALRTGENYEVEYRVKRGSDGAYRWHLCRAMPMRNGRGDISHWVGTCTDIDDKKRAENEKLHLQTSALEATANGIMITNPAGEILWVNPAFTQLTGHTRAEAVGRKPSILKSGAHDAEFYQNLWKTVRAGKVWQGEMVNRRKDGSTYFEEMTITPVLDEQGMVKNFVAVKQDISRRKRSEDQLRAREEAFRALADNVPDAVARVDRNLRFAYGNRALVNDLRLDQADFLGKTAEELNLPHQEHWATQIQQVFATGESLSFEFNVPGAKGISYRESRLVPERSSNGEVEFVLAVTRDVTEHKMAERERQMLDVQLRQAQKMEAIGQLASGIAHEINTPTQYVADNTRFLKDAFQDIIDALIGYKALVAAAKENAVTPEMIARAEETLTATDLDYHCTQIPAAINETLEGVARVSKIVGAMKDFSHPGARERIAADLNKAIDSTVTVARNEWKYVAEMVLDLDPNLPMVPCFVSEFNQAILNLVVNASHTIADVARSNPEQKGRITVRTRRHGDSVEISVSDTGTGIAEEHRQRIFEPFFTTKDVGKGTGQGLTLVYSNIVKKHGGTVSFETEMGKGTTFFVRLPIAPRSPGIVRPEVSAEPAVQLAAASV